VSISEGAVKDLHLNIEPYRFSPKYNERIVYFKHTVIKGYTGIYRLTGSPELIKVTYDAGLGAKSSEGFGMWEIWNREDKND
jgi:CRISPR-associated endoribonuclease Cas6